MCRRRWCWSWWSAATMAPSRHNSQPWRFRFDPASQTIGLYADPERMLRVSDPAGRGVHIACGAALFNLRLAAAAACCYPVVRLDARRRPAAADRGGPAGRPRQPQQQEMELRAAIAGTAHQPESVQPSTGAARSSRRAGGRQPRSRARGAAFPGPPGGRLLLQLAQDAERDLLADPAYRAELARWAGGCAIARASPTRSPDRATPSTPPPCGTPPASGPARLATPGSRRSQLAALSTLCDGRDDWLRAWPGDAARLADGHTPGWPSHRSPSRWKQPTPGRSATRSQVSSTRR